MKITDKIGHDMTQAAKGCHQTADDAANPGYSASAEFAIVGLCFGKSHANASTD